MIVKNEEAVLVKCLDSVKKAVDEIIIVDTGSTDKTKQIAARYTGKVYDFEWIDDFSAARNFSFGKAGMDYQLWLDADDFLPEEQTQRLIALKKTLGPAVDMVTMKYHTHFDAEGNPLLTSTRERLLRRKKAYLWQEPVHECIPLSGSLYHSDIAVWHAKPPSDIVSTRNLNIYEGLEASGKQLSPRQQYYFARELKDHGQYAKAAYYFSRFLDEGQGWIEDNIASCHSLGICLNQLGESRKARTALLRGFEYSGPRAEICCELGYSFMRSGEYESALDWFQTAARLEMPTSLGFVLRDCRGYIPYIESCVCACNLGDFERAKVFNALAKKFKPESTAVKHNELYLSDK
jgi:glycosyltransferase involved in cell wall biosynthesis